MEVVIFFVIIFAFILFYSGNGEAMGYSIMILVVIGIGAVILTLFQGIIWQFSLFVKARDVTSFGLTWIAYLFI